MEPSPEEKAYFAAQEKIKEEAKAKKQANKLPVQKKLMVGFLVLVAIYVICVFLFFVPSCSISKAIISKAESYKDSGDANIMRGNTDQAIADYTKAIAVNSKDGEAYNNRAIMYLDKGEYAKAKEDVFRAQELGYKVSPQLFENINSGLALSPIKKVLEKGWQYSDKHMYDEAIVEFNSAIQSNPNSAEAYYFRAGAYAQKNNLDRAISDYNKAIAINPDYGNAYYNRGLIYLAKQKCALSSDDFVEAERRGHSIAPEIDEKIRQCAKRMPDIKLEGAFVDGHEKSYALINGDVVYEGDSIGSIKITKINEGSVDIAVDGKKENMRVGEIHSFGGQ